MALDLLTLSSLISFGALVAFSVVNLSVIKHFLIDRRERGAREILLHGVLPGIGFLLTAWLWTSLSGTALIVGIVWAALGACYLLVITRFLRKAPPELDMRETDSLETIVR